MTLKIEERVQSSMFKVKKPWMVDGGWWIVDRRNKVKEIG
jgi:hypothetical protein